jgi:hypothetical protein
MIELAVNALVIIALGITMRILDGLIAQPDGRHNSDKQASEDSRDVAGIVTPASPEPPSS